MAGQFRFKNNSGTVVAQISASNAGAISFSGSAVDFSSVATLTLGTSTLTGTASFATTAVSSSYASYALTGSNAMTASSADTLYVRNNITALGSITAQTLVVQTVTSSVLFSTGSNKLGSSLSNTQELTGSVGITGSLSVVTTGTEFQVNAGGVNIGNALTDNHIISGSLRVNPNGLFVSSSGNVGIGTSSPGRQLEVYSATSDTRIAITNTTSTSGSAKGFELLLAGSDAYAFNYVNGAILFGTSGSERMRINSGGGVSISAPAAATGMYVYGKDNYWVSEMKAGGTNNQSFGLKIMASTNTSDTAISINNAADNLNLLKIRGGDGYTQIYGVYNNTAGSSANVFVSSDGGVQRSTASSLRYKENINEWSGNGLSTILALNPKTFTYKSNYYSNPERQFLGLIAEEVAEVSSYLADYENEDKTGQVENVRYANIVVPLIAAMKEQQVQIEELKAEIDILKQT